MNEYLLCIQKKDMYQKRKGKKKRKEEEGKSLNIKIIILFGVKTFKYAYRQIGFKIQAQYENCHEIKLEKSTIERF